MERTCKATSQLGKRRRKVCCLTEVRKSLVEKLFCIVFVFNENRMSITSVKKEKEAFFLQLFSPLISAPPSLSICLSTYLPIIMYLFILQVQLPQTQSCSLTLLRLHYAKEIKRFCPFQWWKIYFNLKYSGLETKTQDLSV